MTQTVPAPVAKAAPAFGLVLVALGIVYVVWGSTYLAIRIVEIGRASCRERVL